MWDSLLKIKKIKPVYVYVVRRADEVAASLYKRDCIPYSYGIRLWTFYNVMIQNFLQYRDALRLQFDELFDARTIEKIKGYCALETIDISEIAKVPKMWLRHNKSIDLQIKKSKLVDDIYNQSLSHEELMKLSEEFERPFPEKKNRVRDDELLRDEKFLDNKNIVIYGAGEYGRKAALMLKRLGVDKFCFCDRDSQKQGTSIDGVIFYGLRISVYVALML